MPLQLLGTFSCKIATQSVAKTQSRWARKRMAVGNLYTTHRQPIRP